MTRPLMQKPTCTRIRIRSTQDAQKIFYAVHNGVLHMVTRRLDADERLALTTGCVYAWEERGPHTEITGLGIERFTEGRRWSPSRVRDEFLFYYEKYTPTQDGNHRSVPPSSSDINSLSSVTDATSNSKHPPRDWDPLVKQTYSVWVETPKGRRKWHLTAYFTQATVDDLGTIDDIPAVRDLVVPPGMFQSTRTGKNRQKPDDSAQQTPAAKSSGTARTYAAFPSIPDPPAPAPAPLPQQQEQQQQSGQSVELTPVLMHNAYEHAHAVPPAPAADRPQSDVAWWGQPAPISGAYQQQHQPDKSMYAPQTMHTSSSARTVPPLPYVPFPLSTADTSDLAPSPSSWHTHCGHACPDDAPSELQHFSHGPPATHGSAPPPHSHSHSNVDVGPNTYIGRPSSSSSSGGSEEHDAASPFGDDYRPHSPTSRYLHDPPFHYELSSPHDPSYYYSAHRTAFGTGPHRDLAPISSLTRRHPYRRNPVDEKTLRLLMPKSS